MSRATRSTARWRLVDRRLLGASGLAVALVAVGGMGLSPRPVAKPQPPAPPASAGARQAPATLVLRNGKIVTVDPTRAGGAGGRHRAATASSPSAPTPTIKRYVGPATEVIDLSGPAGDSRLHREPRPLHRPRRIAAESQPDERHDAGTRSSRWWRRRRRRRSPVSGSIGRGWHQEKWTSPPQPNVEGFPTHASLEPRVAEQSGAADPRQRPRGFANAQGDGSWRASTGNTPNPPGGEILKDAAATDRAAARDGGRA